MGLRTDEFTYKNLEAVPKVVQVLNYLNQGRELELGGQTYRLAETHNGGFNLVFKMQSYSSGQTIEDAHDEWFGYQGDLMHFSHMCNNITEKELTTMVANMVLTDINREQAKRRG